MDGGQWAMGRSSGLVIFDLDNTVVHSAIDFAAIRRDLIALLRGRGAAPGSDAELTRLSIGQIIALGEAHDRRAGTDLGAASWRIVLEYERVGMRRATVEEGAAGSLRALRDARFRLAVLTNNARPATLEALDKFGLTAEFDLVISRDEVAMKPDPAGIALARATLEPAGRTVMVGDSWLDGTAARRAGVPFIAFRPRPGVLEERAIPVWTVVERLGELPAVLSGAWPREAGRQRDGEVRGRAGG